MLICLLLIIMCVWSQLYVYISLTKIKIAFALSAIFKLKIYDAEAGCSLQCRHLIPASVDRTFANAWLYEHPCHVKNKPSKLMTHVACKSMERSVVRSSMHPCSGNWATIRRAVVYYDPTSHTFSAGSKCRHCSLSRKSGKFLPLFGTHGRIFFMYVCIFIDNSICHKVTNHTH